MRKRNKSKCKKKEREKKIQMKENTKSNVFHMCVRVCDVLEEK